jgi:hypothetical protein
LRWIGGCVFFFVDDVGRFLAHLFVCALFC